MSRIFEALRKASKDAPDFPLPAIIEEQYAAGQPPLEPASEPVAAAAEPPAAEGAPEPQHDLISRRVHSIRVPAGAPLFPFDTEHSRAGEQYRIVRTKIVQHPAQPRLMVVSSAGPGDGKTVSSVNIAAALALKDDANVLLIDADFRRSSVAKLLGLPLEPGLADVLAGGCTLEDAMVRIEQSPNLYVLPGGNVRSNPAEMLDSQQWRNLCAAFRRNFHYTVIDAPPVAGVADYDLIQVVCDGVIFVTRPDHTNRKLCFKALETVPSGKLIGVVVNCVEEWPLWKTNDYYYYAQRPVNGRHRA